ncbi:MAG: phosphate ABC transporter permease subunit PstC [Tractidigestivibacter sp.]|jgi:phosphate transport system permease protein|uniref:phosphate ABC transporter permease subunit PstC n=1 Tax=Tractidigestivibacter sp. TaxID=2847320 RepID=UPI003D8EE047
MAKEKTKGSIERRGRAITGACVTLVIILVITLIFMVCSRGLATFYADGVPLSSFFGGTVWNPHQNDANGVPLVGALPMIAGSFCVTLLSCLFALPFALGSAIFVVEIQPTFGSKVFRPMVELLTGIPSVVYGLVGLNIIVPWTRSWAGGTGYGILSASIVLAVMILPTITSLSTDALAAVPDSYRDGSYGLGCTRWQTITHVVLPSALPGILTAIIMGMTRAFGEALAVQMVIGNAAAMPTSLVTPASTLTSMITMSMGNETMGTVYNDVLWSLALVLLVMSLVFILLVHLVGKKGEARND